MLLANMTFQQFLQNPTGPYSSFFGKRENIKRDLEERFYKLLQSARNKDFKHDIYRDGNDYYFAFKIPSEKYNKIEYDVVIRLYPKETAVISESTLLNYNIQFFSNSPAFVYTYAYVSNKDKMLIKFLSGKLGSKALNDPPKVRNPIEIYGFEKSIYFSLLYIKHNNLHIKSALPVKVKKFNKSSIINNCKSSDTIMKEYDNEKMKEKLKKENEKRAEKHDKVLAKNNIIRERNTSKSHVIKPKASTAPTKNKIIKPKKKK